jgi:hypothetical protein
LALSIKRQSLNIIDIQQLFTSVGSMASQGAITAAKDGGHPTEPHVSGHEFADLKGEAVVESDRQAEHDLTLKQVFINHPALAWWSFYWAMAGVGW